MHRIICDINLKTVYTDGRAEMVALHCGKASTSAFDMHLSEIDSVLCPTLYAKSDEAINYIEIEYTLSKNL